MPDPIEEPLMLEVEKISAELRIRPEIYLRIVSSFSKTSNEKIFVLEQGLQTLDLESLRRTLHEIKGTSSNLRLSNVSTAEQLMHEEVKGLADPKKMAEYLSEIKKQAQRLEHYINQLPKQT